MSLSFLKKRWIPTLLLLLLLPLGLAAPAAAGGRETPYQPDLSKFLKNADRRQYVEAMVGYYVRNDPAVRQTLEDGLSALFFFDGCSDNMDDPELSDLSYYRVSAVCLAVRLRQDGTPYMAYFNQECSTLPDRPLDYGAWELDDVGEVGPATIRDGTYEMFSVRHGGAYEAIHVRTSVEDGSLPGVYMTPEGGYANARSTYINIHTRTGNHILKKSMWSSGCLLVGNGDFEQFLELMQSVYYPVYDSFEIGDRIGTVTIDRQMLKEEMYALYGNTNAVDMLLAQSRKALPETYLRQCEKTTELEEPKALLTARETKLMSLPCSAATDVRSVPVELLPAGEELTINQSVQNSVGSIWYPAEIGGKQGYIYSGDLKEPSRVYKLLKGIFG